MRTLCSVCLVPDKILIPSTTDISLFQRENVLAENVSAQVSVNGIHTDNSQSTDRQVKGMRVALYVGCLLELGLLVTNFPN